MKIMIFKFDVGLVSEKTTSTTECLTFGGKKYEDIKWDMTTLKHARTSIYFGISYDIWHKDYKKEEKIREVLGKHCKEIIEQQAPIKQYEEPYIEFDDMWIEESDDFSGDKKPYWIDVELKT